VGKSQREYHGALLDEVILTEAYPAAMIGGQDSLILSAESDTVRNALIELPSDSSRNLTYNRQNFGGD
jgi:hypothetical protein